MKLNIKTLLAVLVTVSAIVGVTALAITILLMSGKAEDARWVLGAVLPLFGTWVGTVLAYYFSRENFEAATDSTERLIQTFTPEDRLRAIPVTDAMTDQTKMRFVSDMDKLVQDEYEALKELGYKRLPILSAARAYIALYYREGLLEYLRLFADAEAATKTFADLVESGPEELKQQPAFVSRTATLAEARAAMRAYKNCKVVFVTESGDSDEPVEGLLTNTDLAEHARL